MPILNEKQLAQLLANGRNTDPNKDDLPVVKLRIPNTAVSWLLTELDPAEPDIAFGLCDLAQGHPEIGYVSLQEISELQEQLGLTVECDPDFVPQYPISVYARAARRLQQITENSRLLELAKDHAVPASKGMQARPQ